MLEEAIQNAIKELSESGDTDLCENLIRDQGVQSPVFTQPPFIPKTPLLFLWKPFAQYHPAAAIIAF